MGMGDSTLAVQSAEGAVAGTRRPDGERTKKYWDWAEWIGWERKE